MDLQAASRAASQAAAHIDAKVKTKLLKRARKQGMTNEREVTELVEAWKRAARHTKRLHLDEQGRHKGGQAPDRAEEPVVAKA
jgi:hypothetical protein